jgi:hypothetical protein
MNTWSPVVSLPNSFGGVVRPSSAGSMASAALHGRLIKRRHKSCMVSWYPSLSPSRTYMNQQKQERKHKQKQK